MGLFKTIENVFAAVAFAEAGDEKTAQFIASGMPPKKQQAQAKKKQADKRARLRT